MSRSCLEANPAPGPDPSGAPLDLGLFLLRMNKGREHLADGRLEEARAEFEAAIALRPGDETGLNLLGLTFFKMDRREEAIAIYRRLVLAHPESDVLHSNLGVLEFKQGRLHDARRRLETALLLNPGNPRPHLYLALIDRRNGDLGSCLEHLDAAGAAELAEKVRSIEPATPSPDPESPLDLVRAAADRVVQAEGAAGAIFTRHLPDAGRPGETLGIRFADRVTVQKHRVSHAEVHDGVMRASSGPLGRMVTLGGQASLELVPGPGAGREFLLIELGRGQKLHVPPERLVAFDGGIVAERHGLESLSHMLVEEIAGALAVSGAGVAALAASRSTRGARLGRGESVIVCPTRLVGWSGAIQARPVSPGPVLDAFVLAEQGAGRAIRMEGPGDVLFELPG